MMIYFSLKGEILMNLTVTSENKDYTIAVSGRIDTLTAPAL